jgi:uncharacterized protein YacL
MRNKKILIGIFLLVLVIIVGYFYVYKSHRDIKNEQVSYEVSAAKIFIEFQTNELEATSKYLDKTIIVSGKIVNLDPVTQSLVVDGKVFATFLNEFPSEIKLNSQITIKGRLIGYDSLLEELKMDQCIIIK